MSTAFVDNPTQCQRMAGGVAWRTPYTGNTELAAAALVVIVRTIYLSPCMTTATLDSSAIVFGVPERCLNFLFWMRRPGHSLTPDCARTEQGCQLTTLGVDEAWQSGTDY